MLAQLENEGLTCKFALPLRPRSINKTIIFKLVVATETCQQTLAEFIFGDKFLLR
jgi:hypothetical protein